MSRLLLSAWLIAAITLPAVTAAACPFCSAVSQTFSEEIGTMDAVVIARLDHAPLLPKSGDFNTQVKKSKFEIVQILKGKKHLDKQRKVEILYFGEAPKGAVFLLMGVEPPVMKWSTPTRLTTRARKYIRQIIKLPKEGPQRLVFFQEHLEDVDEMLARDAYDEFAKAPYAVVKGLKDKMHHDRLVEWIKNPEVPASRRRLYLTMLGICGTNRDIPMLEELLLAKNRTARAGLDAMIASYLSLHGEKGMPLVEDLFLKNKEAEYADTYAAIMALRFHGTETDAVPRKRILQGLHHMLDRPALADLVIVDLARWEDWSVMPRLVELFKTADEKSSWVRGPVVRYVMVCPLPEAKAALEELKKIDPGAVKRAQTFFPFGGGKPRPGGGKPAAKASQSKTSANSPQIGSPRLAVAGTATPPRLAVAATAMKNPAPDGAHSGANPLWLFGVPILSVAGLLLLAWSLRCGFARQASALRQRRENDIPIAGS